MLREELKKSILVSFEASAHKEACPSTQRRLAYVPTHLPINTYGFLPSAHKVVFQACRAYALIVESYAPIDTKLCI